MKMPRSGNLAGTGCAGEYIVEGKSLNAERVINQPRPNRRARSSIT